METLYYVLAFRSAADAIQEEKEIRKTNVVFMIPTPREIHKSCGFALRFAVDTKVEDLLNIFETISVPVSLYQIENTAGKQKKATLLAEKK